MTEKKSNQTQSTLLKKKFNPKKRVLKEIFLEKIGKNEGEKIGGGGPSDHLFISKQVSKVGPSALPSCTRMTKCTA